MFYVLSGICGSFPLSVRYPACTRGLKPETSNSLSVMATLPPPNFPGKKGEISLIFLKKRRLRETLKRNKIPHLGHKLSYLGYLVPSFTFSQEY
jgi:hypothetical protein